MRKFNLLPKNIISKRRRLRRKTYCLLATILCFLVVFMTSFYIKAEIAFIEDRLRTIDNMVKSHQERNRPREYIEKIAQDNEIRQEILENVDNNILSQEGVLEDLFLRVPDSIKIKRLTFSKDGTLKVTGRCSKVLHLRSLMKEMEEIKGLSDIFLEYCQRDIGANKINHTYKFTIRTRVKVGVADS